MDFFIHFDAAALEQSLHPGDATPLQSFAKRG
jgi:hypothetical protein